MTKTKSEGLIRGFPAVVPQINATEPVLVASISPVVFIPPSAISIVMRMQKHVAQHYGIKHSDFSSSSRMRELAHMRQAAMWLIKQALPSASLPSIGKKFNRDHTTVLYALKKVEERRMKNSEYKVELDQLLEELLKMKAAQA